MPVLLAIAVHVCFAARFPSLTFCCMCWQTNVASHKASLVYREAAERAKAEAERCRAMHSRMVSKMDQERKWLSRPGSARVVCVKIGTVDGEDVVEPSH